MRGQDSEFWVHFGLDGSSGFGFGPQERASGGVLGQLDVGVRGRMAAWWAQLQAGTRGRGLAAVSGESNYSREVQTRSCVVGICFFATLTAVFVPLYGKKAKTQKADVEEGSGSQREAFFQVMAQYRAGDPAGIAEANRTLDTILPRSASAKVDPTDKFAHAAAVDFFRGYSAKLPASLRERQVGYYEPRQSHRKLLLSGTQDQLQPGPRQLHADV